MVVRTGHIPRVAPAGQVVLVVRPAEEEVTGRRLRLQSHRRQVAMGIQAVVERGLNRSFRSAQRERTSSSRGRITRVLSEAHPTLR